MQALIIGYGSIGSRHTMILSRLGFRVSVVSAQKIECYTRYRNIEDALKKNFFDQIIIANPTHLHYSTLKKILELHFSGIVLVEKPLFSQAEKLEYAHTSRIYVAYNMRFHELFRYLRKLLKHDELISFSVQVGSYLPYWRKNQNYKNCYSSKKEQGGGVLRDLSHELDYTLWFCGKCIELTAIGGHYSTLDIDSDDVYSILMRCEYCPLVSIQLDYLNRTPKRNITIQTKKKNTIFLDFMQGILSVNGEIKFQIQDAINQTYITQHQLLMKKEFDDFCDYNQGVIVMKLIQAIEQAAAEKKWIQP